MDRYDQLKLGIEGIERMLEAAKGGCNQGDDKVIAWALAVAGREWGEVLTRFREDRDNG